MPVYLPSVRFWISFFTNSWYTEFIKSSSETICASLYSRTELSLPHWLQFHHLWSNVLPVAYGSTIKCRIPYHFLGISERRSQCQNICISILPTSYLFCKKVDLLSRSWHWYHIWASIHQYIRPRSHGFEPVILCLKTLQSLWNWTGGFAALVLSRLWNVKILREV